MPCTQTGSLEGDQIMSLKEELSEATKLTQYLCAVMKILEDINPHFVADSLPTEVVIWWDIHKKIDAKTAAREKRDEDLRKQKRREDYERLKKEFE